MRKKIALFLVPILSIAMIGCGANTSKEQSKSEESEVIESVMPEPVIADTFDPKVVEIGTREFELTKSTIEERVYIGYKIEGSDSALETMVIPSGNAVDMAEALADQIKADSGETPVLDIHEEGVYVTGLFRDQILLSFMADGQDGVYVLNLYTSDIDHSIEIMNGIVEDFLAAGFTPFTERTEYGQEVEESTETTDTTEAE